jgi:hypothetical protein
MLSITNAAVHNPLMIKTIPPTRRICFYVTLPLIQYPSFTAAAVHIK